MKVLVTGASGFIGRHLCARLLDLGYEVTAHYRRNEPPESLRALEKQGLRLWHRDFSAGPISLPADFDQVIHSAAMVSDWGSREDFASATIDTTTKLLQALKGTSCKRFLYVSSVIIYGLGGPHNDTTEELGPYYPPRYLYPEYKRKAELFLAEQAATQSGPEVVIARLSVVYGPGDYNKSYVILDALQKGLIVNIARGRALCSPIYIDDAIRGIIRVLEQGRGNEAYNITTEKAISWREFFAVMARQMGVRPPRFSLPLAVAIALGALLEDIFRFFRIKVAPPLTRYRVAQLRWDNTFSPQKAREELGFTEEVSFTEGVRRLCLAYQKERENLESGN
ncbi:MAG: NAD(P)-dependent oxidoreductase [Spirochaetota bacterium]